MACGSCCVSWSICSATLGASIQPPPIVSASSKSITSVSDHPDDNDV
jgi:hypothetical protein